MAHQLAPVRKSFRSDRCVPGTVQEPVSASLGEERERRTRGKIFLALLLLLFESTVVELVTNPLVVFARFAVSETLTKRVISLGCTKATKR